MLRGVHLAESRQIKGSRSGRGWRCDEQRTLVWPNLQSSSGDASKADQIELTTVHSYRTHVACD